MKIEPIKTEGRSGMTDRQKGAKTMRKANILDYQEGYRKGYRIPMARFSRAILFLDGDYFLFDLVQLAPEISECMGFRCNKKGKIRKTKEVFCRTHHGGLAINRKELMDCIISFIDQEN